MTTLSDLAAVQPSQTFAEYPKDFVTRLLPNLGGRDAALQAVRPGAGIVGSLDGDNLGTTPCTATTPTTADLYALHWGRGRLLTVREAAERLRVGTWAVYHFCETGELPHVRIIDSIRIRPDDIGAFVAARQTAGRARKT